MDIMSTTEPKSDQQNYDDVANSPRTVTITKVVAGSAEQPVEIHLAEFPGRPYKPSKSMRRVLVAAWGPEASAYVGRRITLYGDPSVKFGGIALGGIKISHLSDIKETHTMMLTETRGKRNPHTINPLADAVIVEDGEVVPKQVIPELIPNEPSEPSEAPEPKPSITPAQVKLMGALMGKLQIKDHAQAVEYCAGIIGHDIKSRNDLTKGEAQWVLDALKADQDVQDAGEPGEPTFDEPTLKDPS